MKQMNNHSVKIERIENVKDVRNYIQRIDEMIDERRNSLRKIISRNSSY